MGTVKVEDSNFIIDGKKVRIISGAIHFFRVHRDQWRDRIDKAKMMGCNCIETYVAHNLLETRRGEWDFSGNNDLVAFIEEIHAAGLYAIVRPGPYICAEWEFGGLPVWMLNLPGVKLRGNEPAFLEYTRGYLDMILGKVKPLLYTNGGPVILMQVENEYGSFSNDTEYVRKVRDIYMDNGIDVPLVTSDGAADFFLRGGTIPECVQTLNFGSNAAVSFAKGKEYRPNGPSFCMEFWNGWFDHWGEEHHTRPAEDAGAALEEILANDGSVNFYMFCGGTNFGFGNGANGNGETANDYAPTVTSYDYDSPLSECGDPTPKFFEFQRIIRKYAPDAAFGTPEAGRKLGYGEVTLSESTTLFGQLDRLATRKSALRPPTMDECDQQFGFIHYRTRIIGPLEEKLYFPEVRDRVTAYANGEYLGTIYRNDADRRLSLKSSAEEVTIDLLVENCGRINYGPLVGRDPKGLPGGACINLQAMSYFDYWNLDLADLSALKFGEFAEQENLPAFHRGYFEISECADTFLNFPGVKGVVWVNGVNLGRYWNIGPGSTMYIPAPLLKAGRNEIIVLELHKLKSGKLTLTDKPQLL